MNLMKRWSAGLIWLCVIVSSLPANAQAQTSRLRVVASFSILGDMVKEIADDLATVHALVGPGADAHVYTPSIGDARDVAAADLIFVNGLGFETWTQTLISQSGSKAQIHVATDGITPIIVNGEPDPHAWNTASNAMIYIRNITSALAGAMPEHATLLAARGQAYIDKLAALEFRTRERLAALPTQRLTVVTAHDAFGYLAESYGLSFVAPQGIDTKAEPSAHDVARLIQQLRDGAITALFVENIANPGIIDQISRETGTAIGGRLYSDALSKADGPAPSYLKLLCHNLDAVLSALEAHGDLPHNSEAEDAC